MAIHIYTGNGKGKTTCAVGLAARCAGHGKKVCFYQFLKCEPSGECAALSELVEFHCVKEKFGFVINMTESQKKEVREKTCEYIREIEKLEKQNFALLQELV